MMSIASGETRGDISADFESSGAVKSFRMQLSSRNGTEVKEGLQDPLPSSFKNLVALANYPAVIGGPGNGAPKSKHLCSEWWIRQVIP